MTFNTDPNLKHSLHTQVGDARLEAEVARQEASDQVAAAEVLATESSERMREAYDKLLDKIHYQHVGG